MGWLPLHRAPFLELWLQHCPIRPRLREFVAVADKGKLPFFRESLLRDMSFFRFAISALLLASPLLHAQPMLKTAAESADGDPVADGSAQRKAGCAGVVVDPVGSPVALAQVTLQGADGTSMATVTSDRDGHFVIPEVSSGRYTLMVSQPDFAAQRVEFQFSAVSSKPLRIALSLHRVSTTIAVEGRAEDLVGIASSGSEGTISAEELQQRPILRSGEVLEAVPGLIITQHAGGGKANQYFLRGFNLDHGTDFAVYLDDMPLNLPTHAHGEGYSDMNQVIPELVERLNFEKGPYYAHAGNYASAGSAHLEFFKELPQNFVQVEGGAYGYGRLAFGASQKMGAGALLYAGEAYHDDGPWTHPDNFYKYNGQVTLSRGANDRGGSATARAYHGQWHSSDQIPAAAVALVGRYGSLDPSDGGHSQRYSLQGEAHRQGVSSRSTIATFGAYYDLNLFSDFTYFLVDTTRGDQFEQHDRRWIYGLTATHEIFGQWFHRKVVNSFGVDLRHDWIRNGLYQSEGRERTEKTDAETGLTLPATTEADEIRDLETGIYAENKIIWKPWLRSTLAVRGDVAHVDVTSLVTSANTGTAKKFLPQPKASLVFGPWAATEIYLQAGSSFHSNDARGTTLHVEPVSGENPYPNTAATPIPVLIPTKGAEVGVRSSRVSHLESTLSLWYLHSASELQQSGDTGGTTASRQPDDRYGFEWTNYYTPLRHVAVDFDLSNSRARFTEVDADDAAPESAGSKRVPEAVGMVVASGLSLRGYERLSGSVRVRYFGPRDLTSDGLYRSQATAMVNGEVGYEVRKGWRLEAELLNALNRIDHDIDYAYTARIAPTAKAEFSPVFHPVEPIQLRLWLKHSF